MPDCKCNNCDCDKNNNNSPEEKVEKLKKAIRELGFNVEEEENGDIRVTE